MSNLKNLNKAPETRVLIAAGKGMVRRTGVSGFISQNRICVFCGLGLFRKERDKYKLSLMNTNFFISLRFQHKGILPVVLINIVFVVGF